MSLSDEKPVTSKLPEVLGTVAKAPERKRASGRLDFLLTDLVKLPKGRWLKIECFTDSEANCVRGWLSGKCANYSAKSKSPLAGKRPETRKFGTVLYVKLNESEVSFRPSGA